MTLSTLRKVGIRTRTYQVDKKQRVLCTLLMDVRLKDALLQLWSCFPRDLESTDPSRSAAVSTAPRRTRLVASILEMFAQKGSAGDQNAINILDATLAAIFDELNDRVSTYDNACRRQEDSSTARFQTGRALFLCAVLLLQSAFASAPPDCIARHAKTAFQSLLGLAHCAVQVPQLAELEDVLLTHVMPDCLVDLSVWLISLASASKAQRALVMRWVVAALFRPQLARGFDGVLPNLVEYLLQTDESVALCSQLMVASLGSLTIDHVSSASSKRLAHGPRPLLVHNR